MNNYFSLLLINNILQKNKSKLILLIIHFYTILLFLYLDLFNLIRTYQLTNGTDQIYIVSQPGSSKLMSTINWCLH